MAIQEGYGVVPGRGREVAVRLLAIAEELGLPADVVLVRMGGYEVPTEVLDKYDAELSTKDEAIEDDEQPKLNASLKDWLSYAETQTGFEQSDSDLTRNELIEKFGTTE